MKRTIRVDVDDIATDMARRHTDGEIERVKLHHVEYYDLCYRQDGSIGTYTTDHGLRIRWKEPQKKGWLSEDYRSGEFAHLFDDLAKDNEMATEAKMLGREDYLTGFEVTFEDATWGHHLRRWRRAHPWTSAFVVAGLMVSPIVFAFI